MKYLTLTLMAGALSLVCVQAQAHTHLHHYRHPHHSVGNSQPLQSDWNASQTWAWTGADGWPASTGGHSTGFSRAGGGNVSAARVRGLPWCGAYMADVMGITGQAARELWVAANWAHWGRPAGGPQVGAVVVFRHHVGRIVGQQGGQWVVESGNDGHAVRTRARSLAGAIAFRIP